MSSMGSAESRTVYPFTEIKTTDGSVTVRWEERGEEYTAGFDRVTDDDVIQLTTVTRSRSRERGTATYKDANLDLIPPTVRSTIGLKGFTIAEVVDSV